MATPTTPAKQTRVSLTNHVIALVAAACLACDALSKVWAKANLKPQDAVEFIPGFLNLLLTSNTGAAFSLGHDHSQLMTLVATLVTAVVLAFIVKRHRAGCSLTERIGLGVLLGGALGNLLDRLIYGRVTDFLDFAFISFPVFNVADVCIDVGIGLILIAALREQSIDEKSKKKSGTSTPHSYSQEQ